MPRLSPIPYRKRVRVLELEGLSLSREHGDHMIFTQPGIPRPIVIPRYNPLPVFIIKNALGTARISRERYFELLERA